MGSRHSDIFNKKMIGVNKNASEMYQSTSHRSFSTRNSLSPTGRIGGEDDQKQDYGANFGNHKRSTGAVSEAKREAMEARRQAEERVKRFGLSGSNKALNRGFYDKYTPESVLVAARDESKRTID